MTLLPNILKKKTNSVLIFINNKNFNKLDLYKIYKNLNKNENIFLFTDKYTESWIIKNIYDIYTMREETCAMREETCAMREKTCAMREEDNNYYESIKICPPFKKIINKNFNNIKKLLNLKGIYISEGKIEYIFISYNILFDNSENKCDEEVDNWWEEENYTYGGIFFEKIVICAKITIFCVFLIKLAKNFD